MEKRKMKSQIKRAVSVCSTLAIVSSATPAFAYGYTAHSRIVEEAVYILQNDVTQNPAPPSGVSQTDWDAFINIAKQTPTSLSVLRTGLPTNKATADSNMSPFKDDPPPTEGFPFNGNDGSSCVFATTDNLARAGEFRIQEFPYKVLRSPPCALLSETDPQARLQSLMGWHAGTIDDHKQDTIMWYRPTNSVVFSFLEDVSTYALEAAAAAFLLPIVCIFKLFTGGSCGVHDGQDLVNQVNPVDELESLIPGFGSVYDGDYTGLWHFMHVGAGQGQFSDIRGMLYEGAGDDHPGVVDILIMVGADLSGLSLKPTASDGDNAYGRYDRVSRDNANWQSSTIAHLEWSPVDHLAAYGWDYYKNKPTSAEGLGWVLHALGDAGEPHHITGTTSWGHRPYEEYVDKKAESMLLLADGGEVPVGATAAQHKRVLELAYTYFKTLSSRPNQPANVDAIESLVLQVAQRTYGKVHGQSWVWNDSASGSYLLGGSYKSESETEYIGYEAQMTDIIETSVAASVAFLMYASEFAVDPGLSPNIRCAANQHFEPPSNCAPGIAPTPPVVLNLGDGGICASNGSCGVDAGPVGDAGTGAACSTNADCVVGTCITGTCSTDCSTTPCGKGTCHVGVCCAEDFSPCQSDQDCCGGQSTCGGGVCQAPPPK